MGHKNMFNPFGKEAIIRVGYHKGMGIAPPFSQPSMPLGLTLVGKISQTIFVSTRAPRQRLRLEAINYLVTHNMRIKTVPGSGNGVTA